jgi:hypothetical protein
MIASKVISYLFFSAGLIHRISYFPNLSNSPCMGRFSVGDLNVI